MKLTGRTARAFTRGITRRRFAPLAPALLLALAVFTPACAPAPKGQAIMLALDGPPLAVAGEAGQERFEGNMTRNCMVGSGMLSLESLDRPLICSGSVEGGPGPKGRIRGMLQCDNGERLIFTLRNLGADQGLGIARFVPGVEEAEHEKQEATADAETGAGMHPDYTAMDPLIFFYHPWDEEARRRLGPVRQDIEEAMKAKKQ